MAFVPAALVFCLTWQQANRAIETSGHRSLRAETRFVAFTLLSRLQSAAGLLEQIAASGGIPPAGASRVFEAITASESPRGVDVSSLPKLQLRPDAASQVSRVVLLAPRQRPDGSVVVVAGTLSPRYLWRPDEDVVEGTRVCVRSASHLLGCAGMASPDMPRVHETWDLAMHEFNAAPWRFELERETGPTPGLQVHWFVLLAGGVLLMALLMSLVQIRRLLVPLEALMDRIRVFSGSRRRSAEAAPDELEALAATFEEMRRRIGGQLSRLRALSAVDADIVLRRPLDDVLGGVARQLNALDGIIAAAIIPDAPRRLPASVYLGDVEGICFDATAALRLLDSHRPPAAEDAWAPVPLPPGSPWPPAARAYCRCSGRAAEPRAWILIVTRGDDADEETLEAAWQLADRVTIALALDARERGLIHQSRHDALTELPNRLAATEALDAAIAASSAPFAVVFMDLDRFKAVNDGLGHALGDALLVEVARRLRSVLPPTDMVARFGGDEFVLLLHGASGRGELDAVRSRIDEAFSLPVVLDGHVMAIRYSAGVAFHPIDGGEARDLVRKADVAMYRAKQDGGGRFAVYSAGMNEAAREEVELVAALRAALAAGALEVHYQPRIHGRAGTWAGMEALVRWWYPERGWIPPSRFVPLAERHGLIDALGTFVLRTACGQVAAWRAAGLRPGRVAVNVSSEQMRAGTLVDDFARVVRDTGACWTDLEIEITESLLISDADSGSRQLQALRELGVAVAIDDFGTGYSSLAYLARLPLDTIKIDRAFVVALDEPGTGQVVRSILALASTLGKHVVTEGVETHAQLQVLQAWGCDVFQGYLFHRPMPAGDLRRLLEADAATIRMPG